MADSPETARWFIAELVEELILDGNVKNVIHRKTRVIFADSHEDAYEKALSLSREHEPTYLNQTYNVPQVRYWGLNELSLVQEESSDVLAPRIRTVTHHRKSDMLTPIQLAALMSMQAQALPN